MAVVVLFLFSTTFPSHPSDTHNSSELSRLVLSSSDSLWVAEYLFRWQYSTPWSPPLDLTGVFAFLVVSHKHKAANYSQKCNSVDLNFSVNNQISAESLNLGTYVSGLVLFTATTQHWAGRHNCKHLWNISKWTSTPHTVHTEWWRTPRISLLSLKDSFTIVQVCVKTIVKCLYEHWNRFSCFHNFSFLH